MDPLCSAARQTLHSLTEITFRRTDPSRLPPGTETRNSTGRRPAMRSASSTERRTMGRYRATTEPDVARSHVVCDCLAPRYAGNWWPRRAQVSAARQALTSDSGGSSRHVSPPHFLQLSLRVECDARQHRDDCDDDRHRNQAEFADRITHSLELSKLSGCSRPWRRMAGQPHPKKTPACAGVLCNS